MIAMASQITNLTILYISVIQAQLKRNIKAPRHWPLWGEFTGEFPTQMVSGAENVSFWWRHNGYHLVQNFHVYNTGNMYDKPFQLLVWYLIADTFTNLIINPNQKRLTMSIYNMPIEILHDLTSPWFAVHGYGLVSRI